MKTILLAAVAWIALAVLPYGLQNASASGVISLKGEVYSITHSEYQIRISKNVYHIKRIALPKRTQDLLSKLASMKVVLNVPLEAIDRVTLVTNK